MRPVLLVLPGGVLLWSYGFFIWIGLCAGSLLYWHRYADDPATVPSLFWGYLALGGGFLLEHGAVALFLRGWGALTALTHVESPLDLIPRSGGSLLPGLLIGVLLLMGLYRLRGIPIGPILDRLAPYLALMLGFARIGCFCAGCCFGRPAPGRWGVTFPLGSPADLAYGGLPVWPVQLYESALAFGLAWIALRFPEDRRLIACLLGYGLGRFLLEFLRGDPRGGIPGIPGSPSQFLGVVLVSAGLLLWRHRLRGDRGGRS